VSGDRTKQRWSAQVRVAARKLLRKAKTVLLTEPGDVTHDEAEIVGAEEMAKSAGELKGGVAKVAQLMAYLEAPGAAVEDDARAALGVLWDDAPPVDEAIIRAVIEAELGPVDEVFQSWDREPLAAASLGQVHAATGEGGVSYAVKVQYPDIAEALRSDLASASLVRQLAGGDVGAQLDDEAVAVLRDAVLGELDYTAEGKAIKWFARAFRPDDQIVIPGWVEELSTERVLTMERAVGRSLSDVAASGDAELASAVGMVIMRYAWSGPLTHCLLNADPNPGNYIVLEGEPTRVAFIDYGCAVKLDRELIGKERKLWRAVLHHDPFEGGERFRHMLSHLDLLGDPYFLTSALYREWEKLVTAPFQTNAFTWDGAYAYQLSELTGRLVRQGALALPAPLLLLWRQRLGTASMLGALGTTGDFRSVLRDAVAPL
jgi:predicted unusual protein kinase regulating ubiquinone biosynthesis (AarF/ABC1/UbiB family)